MASENIKNVTDNEFKAEVLDSSVPVLVDFWAPWCAPCRAIAPDVEALAESFVGKLKVYKMNVDENPTTPTQYGVRGIPTILIIKGGQVVDQIVGRVPRSKLEDMVKKVM
jgi:thioredoxin 1